MVSTQQRRARTRKVKALPMDSKQEERRAKRLALKQARADRIRSLKERHPKPGWQEIGDFCGISARGAQAWQEKGSISVENAHRLAELWGVSFDWLYWGPEETGVEPTTLESIDARVTEIQQAVGRLEAYLEAPDAVRRLRGRLEARDTRRQGPSPEDEPEDEPGTSR